MRITFLLCLCAIAATTVAQEVIDLDTPIDVRVGHATVGICEQRISRKAGIARTMVVVELCKVDEDGEVLPDGDAGLVYRYDETTTPTGAAVDQMLNSPGPGTVEKRLIQRLQLDNPGLAGPVTGSPR